MDSLAFGFALAGIFAIVLMLSIVTWHTIVFIVGGLSGTKPVKELASKPSDDQESDLVAEWQNSSDWWPEWVKGRVEDGKIVLGAQLPTKDGRRVGNAVVYALTGTIDLNGEGHHVYEIITDAGSSIKMTEAEIAEVFYAPEWIIDINTHVGVQKHLAQVNFL